MCENCDERRAQLWDEIEDLTDFTDGPVSKQVKLSVERNEITTPGLVESARCAMIAVRCAEIAAKCKDSQHEGASSSLILGTWAGLCLEGEMKALAEQEEFANFMIMLVDGPEAMN